MSLAPSKKTGQAGVSHSAGLAICSPRGMGDPHDIAPRGSELLSCVPIAPVTAGRKVGGRPPSHGRGEALEALLR